MNAMTIRPTLTPWKFQLMGWVFVAVGMLAMGAGQAQAQAQDPGMVLWDLYKQGQADEVVCQGNALLNTCTESGSILLGVGRSLADMQSNGEALFFLQRAVVADRQKTWVYAWAQVYVGKCRYSLEEMDQAREAWILARDCGATLNATKEAIMHLKHLGLAESYDHWTSHETEHFSFHFSPLLAATDRELFGQQHELMYDQVTAWFDGGPDRKIRFFVWEGKEEARQAGMPELGFSLSEK